MSGSTSSVYRPNPFLFNSRIRESIGKKTIYMKHLKYFFALTVAVSMASCSSKDDVSLGSSNEPIKISASISGMKTRSEGNANDLQNTDFVDGEQIKVYLLLQKDYSCLQGLPSEGYLTYTKGASGWTSNATGQIFWPNDDGLFFVGFYPSTAGAPFTEAVQPTFSVQEDQTKDEDYKKSDLMSAESLHYDHPSPVNLQFKHMLSKITVKVDANGVYDEELFNSKVYMIRLQNICREATINFPRWSQCSATSSGASQNQDVYIWYDGTTYNTDGVSCIIPPQTVSAGTDFIFISYDDMAEYNYQIPSGNQKFEAGNEYIYTIKLNQSSIESVSTEVKPWTTNNISGNAY